MLRGLAARLRALARPGALAAEIDEELRGHLAREVERNVARGMDPTAAAYAARRAFGNLTALRDDARAAYGGRWLETLRQDVRYAVRALRRAPGLAAAAVGSIALGIGANAAVFSAVDALLLRKLPVARPDALVTLEQAPRSATPQPNAPTLGFVDYERFRTLPVFTGVAATTWADGFGVTATGDDGVPADDGARARISVVTGNFFHVLGVRAELGRTLDDGDDGANGAHPVVVISDRYWARRFARARDVVGRRLTLLGTTYTIVGVAARGFDGDWVGWPTDLWIPVAMAYQVLAPNVAPGPRGGRWHYKLLARLAPGITAARAEAVAGAAYRQLVADAPLGSGVAPDARLVLAPVARGYSTQRDEFRQPLAILMAVVGVVLLVACANVANLLLARAAAREREIAVRVALGAGRARVVRQLLTESGLLGAAGGALGLLLARLGTRALEAFGRAGPVGSVNFGAASVDLDLGPNGRVLLFTAATCVLTSVVSGLAPAWRAARVPLLRALTARGADPRRATTSSRDTRLGAAGALVVVQVALSVVLLAAAVLLARSLRNLRTSDLGIARDRLLLVWTLPGYAGRERADLAALYEAARQRVASLPGVVGASQSVTGLFGGGPGGGPPLRADGAPAEAPAVRPTGQMNIGPEFFATVGQRLLAGRDFDLFDDDRAPPVAIVDASLARRLFGTPDAVGRRVIVGSGEGARPYAIVGVVSDAKLGAPRDAPGMTVYFPYAQSRNLRRLCLVVRVAADPVGVARRVRRELHALDPSLPVLKIDTVDEQLEDALFRDRLVAQLSVLFAALALLLACLGLYGVLAYTTARRTSEIGIRMTLGATRGAVLRGVLSRSLRLAGAGVVLGVAGALAATRAVASRLYGVGASDPATLAGVAFLMLAVAALASVGPARLAASVDPTTALRHDRRRAGPSHSVSSEAQRTRRA